MKNISSIKCVACGIVTSLVLSACLDRRSSEAITHDRSANDDRSAKEASAHQKYDPDAPQYNDDPGM